MTNYLIGGLATMSAIAGYGFLPFPPEYHRQGWTQLPSWVKVGDVARISEVRVTPAEMGKADREF